MPVITFDTIPDRGHALTLAGQHYRLEAAEPYTRKDGQASTVLRWRTTCTECGAPFTFGTGMSSNGFNRRCPEHSRPGSRIDRRKGGKRKR